VTTETVVARLADIAPGTAHKVEVDGRAVALIRCGDDVYAISDICSHANVSLSEGEVLCEEREIECWKHGSTFSLVDGEPQSLPATQPVPVYDVEVRDGDVIVRVPS
jgi:3-phenylpropionate/trans-cinnamate dioxygenase ferredoxin subunit